jgi:hypothetical protein
MDYLSSIPNREAMVSPLSDGHFRLVRATDAHPLTPIQFNTRKAARNWASGRGYSIRDAAPSGSR